MGLFFSILQYNGLGDELPVSKMENVLNFPTKSEREKKRKRRKTKKTIAGHLIEQT